MDILRPSVASLGRLRRHADGVFVFSWFLIVCGYLVSGREFPYLFEDEYGVLGAAAALAGYEWTTPEGMPFYGFGLSLLVAPLFTFDLNPGSIYRATLGLNAVLVASSAVLAHSTLRMIAPRLGTGLSIAIVIASFSYPAAMFYAGLALGETLLLLSLTLILRSIAALACRDASFATSAPVMLGFAAGFAPYAHTRGLIFAIALIVTTLMMLWKKWLSSRPAAIMMISAGATGMVMNSVKQWLLQNFYSQARTDTVGADDFLSSRLTNLSAAELTDLGWVALGQLAYITTASFGLYLIGLGCCWRAALRGITENSAPAEAIYPMPQRSRAAVGLLLGLSALLMFGASVAQLMRPEHGNHYVYGRYNEVVLPLLLMVALVLLTSIGQDKRGLRLSLFIFVLVISGTLVSLLLWMPKEVWKLPTFWTQITSWFVHIQDAWKIEVSQIALGALIGALLLLSALAISGRLFCFVLGAMFFAAAYQNVSEQHAIANDEWGWYARLGALHSRDIYGVGHVVGGSVSAQRWNAEALQLALPGGKVEFGSTAAESTSFALDMSGDHCVGRGIQRSGSRSLCIMDPALRDRLRQLSPAVPLSPSARDAPPVEIDLVADSPRVGGALDRACAELGRYFYTRWMRWCLPSIAVRVRRGGLYGTEYLLLGVFLIDEADQWKMESRHRLDVGALARGKAVSLRVPVLYSGGLKPGKYRLSAAMVDDQGWDWRGVKSVPLTVD